jgi:hypothetical protein
VEGKSCIGKKISFELLVTCLLTHLELIQERLATPEVFGSDVSAISSRKNV